MGRSTPARARVVTPSDGAAGPAGAAATGAAAAGAPGAAMGAAKAAAAGAAAAAAPADPAAEEATGEVDVEPVAGVSGGVPGSTSYEGDGDPRARTDSTSGEGVTKPGGGGRWRRAGESAGVCCRASLHEGGAGAGAEGAEAGGTWKKGNTVSTKYTCLEVYTR
nr:predicted GPI-anchored protein 23 [Aegilops tauschii subsp. strangulata]